MIEAADGFGKTALLAAAERLARDEGFQILSATANELESGYPFGCALQLFEPAMRRRSDEERRQVLAGAAGLCAPLFDATAHPARASGDEGLFPLIHGLYWATVNLSSARPVVLLVDDLQWADEETVRFLTYLVARLSGVPVAVVVTVRRGRAARSEGPVALLCNHPHAQVLALAPLTRSAVASLVREVREEPTESFVDVLHELTKGSPSLVRAYLGAVELEGIAADDEGAAALHGLTPESLERPLLSRLALLAPDERRVLEAVCVLGEDVNLEDAAALADVDPPQAALAVRRLADADLVVSGSTIHASHPFVRGVVLRQVESQRLHDLHRDAARRLALSGTVSAGRVAGHLLHVAPAGDDWVVAALWTAANRASANGAPQAAVRFLERALREPPLDDLVPDLLGDLGAAQVTVGQTGGIDTLNRAVRRTPSRSARARILGAIGRTLALQGRHSEAADAFADGLSLCPTAEPDHELALKTGLLSLGRLHVETSPVDPTLVLELRRHQPGTDTTAGRLARAELAFHRSLRATTAEEVRLLVAPLLDQEEVESDAAGEPAAAVAAAALGWVDCLEEAEAMLSRLVASARTEGAIHRVAAGCYRRAMVRYHQGKVSDALADAEEAAAAVAYGWSLYLPGALGVLGACLIERGELHRAAILLTQPEREDQWENRLPFSVYLEARSRLRLALGDAEGALADARQAGSLVESFGVTNVGVAAWRSAAALALDALGAADEARVMVDEELRLASAGPSVRARAATLRVRGRLLRGDQQLECFREAIELAEQGPAHLEQARAHFELGAALRRRRRRTRAVEHLRRARELAVQCGATVLADLAIEESRAAGANPRRLEVVGPASLTPGERRVVELAAKGLTNREIAEQLFVSVKAVEWHLGNSYAKLGVTGRRNLASALREDSLAS